MRGRACDRIWAWVACCLAALLVWASDPAHAQLTDEQKDYVAKWQQTASRAEQVIDANRASTAALEQLRQQLVTYREEFLAARDRNSARISTLQSQLTALGPAPENGSGEPEEVAQIRANLNTQLNQSRVPVVMAQQAYSRSDGLITEIDRIIRDRQKAELLARSPTPLLPANWFPAGEELLDMANDLADETRASWKSAQKNGLARKELPVIAVLTIVGLVLVIRGHVWADRLGRFLGRHSYRGQQVWAFLVSFGRILFPLAGIVCVFAAISASGVLGLRGDLIAQSIPVWVTFLLGFNWLALQVFPKHGDPLLPVPAERCGNARWNFRAAAGVLVANNAFSLIKKLEQVTEATSAVVSFLLILIAGYLLMRFRVLISARPSSDGEASQDSPSSSMVGFSAVFRLVSLIAGIGGPILAAAGYVALAEAIVFPTIMTVALFGQVRVLQKFLSDLYGLVTGKEDTASESLVPALAGFLLSLAAVAPLALIWGARVADLTELWQQFLEGFQLGETRVSPTDFLVFLVVFGLGYTATRLLQGSLANNLLPRTSLDAGGRNAVVSGTGYVGIFLAALIAISAAGIDLSSIALVAGALSVGIGFGLQTIVQNFVSGIILLIERPISEGDWIEVNGQMGYVRHISVRSTIIETFDRSDVIVPNADFISGTVTNYTRGDTVGRLIVPVGVAYGTDTRRVEGILREIAEAHPMVLAAPPPSIVFQGFGADSLNFEIRAILRDVNWMLSVKTEMNHQIAKRFAEEEIEIPFAQRDIWLRNPEALSHKAGGQDETG